MDTVRVAKRTGKILGLAFAGIVLFALIAHTALDIYVRTAFRKEIQKIRDKGEPVSYYDLVWRSDKWGSWRQNCSQKGRKWIL